MRLRPVVLALAVALTGCASVETPDYWEPTKEVGYWKETRIVQLGSNPYSEEVHGWTIRDPNPETGVCWIILTPSAIGRRDCVIKHELRHCAGWDHPKYPRAFNCP